MKRIATFAIAAVAAIGLAACGQSDTADDAAQADNVEMPAEEAVSGLDESAEPAADAAAEATDAAEEAVEDAEAKM